MTHAQSTSCTRTACNTQVITQTASWTAPHTDDHRVPVQAHGHARSRGLPLTGVLRGHLAWCDCTVHTHGAGREGGNTGDGEMRCGGTGRAMLSEQVRAQCVVVPPLRTVSSASAASAAAGGGRDESQTQNLPGWGEGRGGDRARQGAGGAIAPGRGLEGTYLSLSTGPDLGPRPESSAGPSGLAARLCVGEGVRVCLCPSPAAARSRSRRHLLDCAVRASTVGVKTPTPISERAASWKRYSVSGFKSSRV